MKRLLLVLLLISIAAAESGVSPDDVTVRFVKAQDNTTVYAIIRNGGEYTIHDVSITLEEPPGITVVGDKTKLEHRIKPGDQSVYWKITTELPVNRIDERLTVNLVDISWDDSTELKSVKAFHDGKEEMITDGIRISSETNNIKITLETEDNSFYQSLSEEVKAAYGKQGRTKVEIAEIDENGLEKRVFGEEAMYALEDGTFEDIIKLQEKSFGEHIIRITVEDIEGKTGNKESITFIVDYKQTFLNTVDEYSWIFVLLILALIALAVPLSGVILMHRRGKKKEEKEKNYKKMLERRKKLREEMGEFDKRAVSIGLNQGEKKRKEAHQIELTQIEEHLLTDERHLKKLRERARKTVEQVESGVPSKEIMGQLKKEGYSPKEIAMIKQMFRDLKG